MLASDAAHFYDNMRRKNPFPLVYHVGDMVQGWQTVTTLAEDDTCIIPGHDPAVADLFSRMQIPGVEAFVLHKKPDEKAWERFTAS